VRGAAQHPAHGLHRVVDQQDQGEGEAQSVLADALPLLSEAAGSKVEGFVGDADPLAAVHDAVNLRGFDEIIISTLSPRLSRWLKLDLPSKLSGLGLPVETVTPSDEPASEHDMVGQA
jgi:cell pole-organizing protein PopZ